jgi:ribosomal protein S18 acetylase RimI-like enzyme
LNAYIRNRVSLVNYNLEGVTINLAKTEDFQQIALIVDKFQDYARITERTGRGDVCVVAYKYGILAHVRWAAITPLPYRGKYKLHLAPDEAYTYDAYTLPAFRRQGIGSEARVFLMDYLKQQGVRCAYTDSRVDNLHTQHNWRKRHREGRERVLGIITVATRFGMTQYTFTAESEDTRPIMARLFHVPQKDVRIHSIQAD